MKLKGMRVSCCNIYTGWVENDLNVVSLCTDSR